MLIKTLQELYDSCSSNNIGFLIYVNSKCTNIFRVEEQKYYIANPVRDYKVLITFDVCRLMLYLHTIRIYKLERRPDDVERVFNEYRNLREVVLVRFISRLVRKLNLS